MSLSKLFKMVKATNSASKGSDCIDRIEKFRVRSKYVLVWDREDVGFLH